MFMLLPSTAGAVSPFAPVYAFEMSGEHYVPVSGSEYDLALMTLHESSSNWVLFVRHAANDMPPYDDLRITLECDGDSAVFNTTYYDDWNTYGYVGIEFPYGDTSYDISYNEIEFQSRYSTCTLSVDDFSGAAYINNSRSYTYMRIEAVPYLSTVEFIDCDEYDYVELMILGNLNSFVVITYSLWNISWLLYSLFALTFALFMIPTFIFIMIRWVLYKMSGYKIVPRSDR